VHSRRKTVATASTVASIVVTPQINDFTPVRRAFTAVGSPAGAAPVVRLIDAVNGQDLFPPFLAYNADFRGGVRVAVGDVNGDGYKDIVTSPGPGGTAFVAVYSGLSGKLLTSFRAYNDSFQGGAYVAVADVNGDKRADIITAAGEGGGPHVRVFDGATFAEIRGFMAYPTTYVGGVTVAAGDVDGDGKAEVITAPVSGPTTTNDVRVFSVTANSHKLVTNFSIADATAGVNIATANIDGDKKVEIIVGPTNNVNSKVRVFNGASVEIGSFNAFDTVLAGGIRLAGADIDGDGKQEIIAGAVTNNTARIRILSGLTGTLARELTTAVVSSSANVFLAGGSAFGVV
jgi:serralysin